MFSPLPADETAAAELAATAVPKPKVTPILPVPADAPSCRWRHPVHGEPTAMWAYHDAAGRLMAYAARVEYEDAKLNRKKDVLPITYCRVEDGEHSYFAWRACGLPEPRPLYHLRQLLTSSDAPVIIAEGEKTADAVGKLFPG
jgi:hypothetical protein